MFLSMVQPMWAKHGCYAATKKGNIARGIGEVCIEETMPIGDMLTCRMQGLFRSQEGGGGGGRRKRRKEEEEEEKMTEC